MKLLLHIRGACGSLRMKMMVPIMLMMIVIVLMLTSLVSRTYTRTILEQEDVKMQSAFSLTGNAIRELLESARSGSPQLLLNDKIELYIANRFTDNLDRVLARKAVLEEISDVLLQRPSLYGMLIMREDGTAFGSLPYRNYFSDKDPLAVLNGRIIEDIQQGQTWIGPYPAADLYQFPISRPIPDQVLLGINVLHSNIYGKIYALSAVDVQLLANHMDLLADGRSRFYLMTADGVELARSGAGTSLSAEVWNAVDLGQWQGSLSVTKEFSGERVYVCYQKIDSLNWYLVRELPMESYDRTVSELRMYVWRIAGAVFIAALIGLLYWTRSFMKTFDSLRAAIGRLRNGYLETRIEKPFQITEFESIRREFNDMNIALQQLMQTTRAMERAQLELELRNLQTQLSPHMIFNSITAIRWMATMMGADRVSDMLTELSEMLRPVFRDWKVEWTLGEELQHLEHYARLLDLRYGNNFVMDFDVPDEMHSQRLPRFTFQPLVENACEHGGINAAVLRVSIRGWIENGRVCFCVSDNGTGIPPEHLAEIIRRIDSGEHTESVGLYSVYSRLRLCMGDSSLMRVDSPPGGGTQVYLSWQADSESYQIQNLPFEN